MQNFDERIDNYIARSADFAIPLLSHLRELIHACCPEVKETIKWGFPHFEYEGSILCSMASFKAHCAFGFWLGPIMEDTYGLFKRSGDEKAMGQWGQLKSLNDLPKDKIMAEYIVQAMQLIESGVKLPKKAVERTDLKIPLFISKALKQNPAIDKNFKAMSYSHKKEYLQWITEAKTEATRLKRLDTAMKWIADGKGRNWKYER